MKVFSSSFSLALCAMWATTGPSGCGGDGEDFVDRDPCDPPRPPVMSVIHAGAVLSFQSSDASVLQVGTSLDPQAAGPDRWLDARETTLPGVEHPTAVKVFARVDDPECGASDPFAFTYEVMPSYPPAAGVPGSRAVAADDPSIRAWASAVDEVIFGEDVDAQWQDTDQALGPPGGNASAILCLGRGGSATLSFDPPITDGPGPDLAVFENGFTDDYLELAAVEVSSDGEHYLRFDHAYLGDEPLGPYDRLDTTLVGGLAGKYRKGYGTPFDLAVFRQSPEVRHGLVDLREIRYVRVLDVPGDGSWLDSFGHPVFDPYPTTETAGFDLDAVAVLHAGR